MESKSSNLSKLPSGLSLSINPSLGLSAFLTGMGSDFSSLGLGTSYENKEAKCIAVSFQVLIFEEFASSKARLL